MSSRKVRKVIATVVVFLGVSLGLTMIMVNRTSAINSSSIVSKAVFEGVYGCFNSGAYRKTFYASDPSSFVLNNGSTEAVKLPYGMTNVGDNNLNCREVMLGYNNDSGIKGGLIPNNVRDTGANITTVKNYFAGQSTNSNGLPAVGDTATGTTGGIGYKAESVTEGTGSSGKMLTYRVGDFKCVSGESNPNFSGKNTINLPTVVSTDSGLKITNYNDISADGGSFVSNCGSLKFSVGAPVVSGSSVTLDLYLGNEDYQTITYTKSGSNVTVSEPGLSVADENGNYINLNPSSSQPPASGSTISDYKLTWGGGNWMDLLKGLNGNNRAGISVNQVYAGYNYLALTRQELFDLYVYYIEDANVFNAKLVAEGSSDYSGVDINLCPDKKYKVNKSNAADRRVYGVDSNLHFNSGPFSLDEIISALSAQGPFNDINNGGRCGTSNENGSYTPSSSSLASSDIVDCNQFDNIGAMQWILCPVMNNEQHTASWVDRQTQEWLAIDTGIYDNDAVKNVWSNIRNVANIVMIVFFLIIIFSQVTGYGIDNYGIKKMLPRLIVMAIIINLSFYICQLAIDASNIAGVGLRNMFTAIGMGDSSVSSGGSFIGSMVTGLFAAGATGGPAAIGAFSAAMAAASGGIVIALVVAVIVFLLVVLVAVVVLFLMLGAREIIVIVCIVLSPLAFAAFILPNTQNLFKKWWELFKAAIIIFPICGMMAGISNMLRGLYDEGAELNVWAYAILLVLPYLGFFLIPILLKNALSALGKVGGALSSLGNTVKNGGRAMGQAGMKVGQNTNRFKDWQQRQQERNAQRAVNRVKRLDAQGRRVSDGDRQRALEAQRKLNEIMQNRYLAEAGAPVLDDATAKSRAMSVKEAQELKNYSDQYANLTRAQMGNELTSAITAYNGDRSDANALRLQAAIIASEGKGMNKEMLSGFGGIGLDSTNANDAKVLSRLAGSSDKVLSQYGIQMSKLAAPDYKHKEVDANGNAVLDANGNQVERELTADERNISLNDFIGSQKEVKLSKVSSDKGPSWLNAVNDDTWDKILTTNADAVDTHTLITAATNTTDGKVLAKVNEILAKRKIDPSEKYKMSTAELSKLKLNTLRSMNPAIYSKAIESIKADPNSAANQQILNAMEQDVKADLGLDDASLVQARGMQAGYATKTASDVYDEAVAENNRMDAQKQQEAAQAAAQQQVEMNNLHGQALEENKEWDRRQADIQQREAQTKALNRLADTMERFTGNNPGGQGPAPSGQGPTRDLSRDGDNIPRPDSNTPIPMSGPVQTSPTFQPPAVVNNNPTFQPPAVVRNNPASQPPAPRPNRGPNNGPNRRA